MSANPAFPIRSTSLAPLVLILLGSVAAGCRDEGPEGRLRTSGTIEVTEVRVAAQTPGTVWVRVDEGSHVQEGDTLAVVDHDLLSLQLQQAEAVAEAAQAQLDLLREGARHEDVAQAQAQLRQAEIQLSQAQTDARRMKALLNEGSVTQKQQDDAQARYQVAQAQYEAAAQALRKLQRLARPEEVRAATAQFRQAEAAAKVLRRQIQDATLLAPLTGVVTMKVLDSGELAGPGTPVVTLADLSRAYLRVYVPEPQLGRIQLGQPVEVYTDTYPERPFEGHITFISPQAEFTPKNVQTQEERVKLVYEVKVEIPNPEGIFKPGMYADAMLDLNWATFQEPTARTIQR